MLQPSLLPWWQFLWCDDGRDGSTYPTTTNPVDSFQSNSINCFTSVVEKKTLALVVRRPESSKHKHVRSSSNVMILQLGFPKLWKFLSATLLKPTDVTKSKCLRWKSKLLRSSRGCYKHLIKMILRF